MKISVIIPTYNRVKTLMRAVNSVLNQTLQPSEIIIVDDRSTDETIPMLAPLANRLKVITQPHNGVSSARNHGVLQASSPWIAFLDSDDEWLPQKLETQASYLSKFPHIQICHTDEIWIRNGIFVNQGKKHQKQGGWIYENCLPLCAISPSSILIKKDIFGKEGLFDETLPACEDYDMWLRLTYKYEVLYIENKLVRKYGGHPDQLSKSIPLLDLYRIYAMEKILPVLPNPQHKQATLFEIAKKSQIYARGCLHYGNYVHSKNYLKKANSALNSICMEVATL